MSERAWIELTERQRATIVAALRFHLDENLQAADSIADRFIADLASNRGQFASLTRQEIEQLCQRLDSTRSCPPCNKTEASSPQGQQDHIPHVIIAVSGGVAEVLLKPRGLLVSVYDYDVEGEEGERITPDPDGHRCCVSQYPAEERVNAQPTWPIALHSMLDLQDSAPSPDLAVLGRFLQDRGFVLITHDHCATDPQRRYEAWAYTGPLDFHHAGALCFGLGADPVCALHALQYHLMRHDPSTPGT